MKEKIYQTIKATLRRCNPNVTPEELEKMTKDYVAKAARMSRTPDFSLMQFGRKAPTVAELKKQWQEQKRHEAEIRQRFTDGRTGYFHLCKDGEDLHQESNDSEVFEYEGEFKPIMLNPEMMIEVKEENPIKSGKPMCSSSAWIK